MIPSLILAAALSPNTNDLSAAAVEDAKQFMITVDGVKKYNPSVYYVVADATTNGVLRWVLSSCSIQPEVELCVPVPVAPNLYRINLDNLGWDHTQWELILKHKHPYGGYSMIIRGDWLATDLLDAELSASRDPDGLSSYERLLYNGTPPQNEEEFFKFWEVDATKLRGNIEGDSQVNRRGRRLVIEAQAYNGYAYFTRDSERLDTKSDPLERPENDFVHSGSEYIVGRQKFSSAADPENNTGIVQYYMLSQRNDDGSNTRIVEAPVKLVEDSTRARGIASIRTWISCVQCHVDGLHEIDVNALLDLHRKYGILTLSTDPNRLATIRRFHFGNLNPEIRRGKEDYAKGVFIHTGWTPKELVEAIESVVRGYDANLTLPKLALELGVDSELLTEKVRGYSTLREGAPAFGAPAKLLELVNGGSCSRDLVEEQFEFVDNLVKHGGVGTHATTPTGVSDSAGSTADDPGQSASKPVADSDRVVPKRGSQPTQGRTRGPFIRRR